MASIVKILGSEVALSDTASNIAAEIKTGSIFTAPLFNDYLAD